MSTSSPLSPRPVGSSVRVPQLAIRKTPSCDTSVTDCAPMASTSTIATSRQQDEKSTFVERPLSQVSIPTLESPSSERSFRSSYLSANFSDGSRDRGKTTSPAKKSGVFGFLTLKEPSALALEQFAEGQKRSTSQKAGRATDVGMSGVSSKRLPNSVPKVNSKWDGMPDRPREASASEQNSRRQNRRPPSNMSEKTWRSSTIMSSQWHKRPLSLPFNRDKSHMANSTRASVQSTVPSPSYQHSHVPLEASNVQSQTSASFYPDQFEDLLEDEGLAAVPPTASRASNSESFPLTPEPESCHVATPQEGKDLSESTKVWPFSPAMPPADEEIVPSALLDLHFGDLEVLKEHISSTPPLMHKESLDKEPLPSSSQEPRAPAINFSRPRTQTRALKPIALPTPTLSRSVQVAGRISEEQVSHSITVGNDEVAAISAS